MTLDDTSTISDAIKQYSDNLSWEGSPTKAVLALEAVRFLLVRRSQAGGISGRNWTFESLMQEKEKLEAYVSTSGAASQAGRSRFTKGRALNL